MLTKSIALETANKFLKSLKQNGFNPTQAYIFGSVARGEIHEYSDIDLAVWDRNFVGVPHLDIEKTYPLLRGFKQIELHTYNEADTEETNPFIEVIKKTGFSIPIHNL